MPGGLADASRVARNGVQRQQDREQGGWREKPGDGLQGCQPGHAGAMRPFIAEPNAAGGSRRFARHVPGRHLATSVPCLGTLISFVRWVRSLRDAFEKGFVGLGRVVLRTKS